MAGLCSLTFPVSCFKIKSESVSERVTYWIVLTLSDKWKEGKLLRKPLSSMGESICVFVYVCLCTVCVLFTFVYLHLCIFFVFVFVKALAITIQSPDRGERVKPGDCLVKTCLFVSTQQGPKGLRFNFSYFLPIVNIQQKMSPSLFSGMKLPVYWSNFLTAPASK